MFLIYINLAQIIIFKSPEMSIKNYKDKENGPEKFLLKDHL